MLPASIGLAGAVMLTACTVPTDSPTSPASGRTCTYSSSGSAAKPVDPPSGSGVPDTGTVRYRMAMTTGDVVLTLDRAKAPCTVHSFESLATQGFYDQTRCHRLVDEGILVLQCGDPAGTGAGGPGYTFADELNGQETYTKGVVAMANAGPNTNGSQFFLVYGDSTALDQSPNYTIFGSLDEASLAVLEKIAAGGHDNSNPAGGGVPRTEAVITSVEPA
jgi:cyclophilin family peptidyl-prolyl cis-trans isomerase